MEVIILTGMSGSGKTAALHLFEDCGYYCVDNIPTSMMNVIIDLLMKSRGTSGKVALVTDVRGGNLFDGFSDEVAKISALDGVSCRVLFMEASEPALINRYKETRRKHPLANEARGIGEAVMLEKKLLSDVRSQADFIVDTTNLSVQQLKSQILGFVNSGSEAVNLIINVVSFGFKYGAPHDADMVFDVRCLPNPHYVPELKPKTGLDPAVCDYIFSFGESCEYLKKINDMLEFLVPHFIEEGKTQLMVCIGCTGGQHRSVAFAEKIAAHLSSLGYSASAGHRDMYRVRADV